MIRIGFDPGMDAQQEHRTLIQQNELIRLAQEGFPQKHGGLLNASRLLARIGKEITTLGANLETRFSENLEDPVLIDSQDPSSDCSS